MSKPEGGNKYFTKHLFRAGLQCPTKLHYYFHHYPEDEEVQPFLEHAGYNKWQLKAVAQNLHPQGILVRESSIEAAHKTTQQELSSSPKVLFDAVFIHDSLRASIPVLIKEDEYVQLYFIQTKAINPHKHRLENHHGEIHKKWEQYIYDAAFQLYIIKKLYPAWNLQPYLLLPDKTAKAQHNDLFNMLKKSPSDINEEALFYKINIKTYTDALLNGQKMMGDAEGSLSFSETIEALSLRYFEGAWHAVDIGKKCKHCEFRISPKSVEQGKESGFNHCWNEAKEAPAFSESEPHVFDLIGPGINEWMESGIYLQKDIPLKDLPRLASITTAKKSITQKQRQLLQVRQAKGREVPREIIKDPIFEEIQRWQYPLHFLDFEAGNYAVPIRKDRSPYHLVAFQFSCHTLQADGTLTHTDWVAKKPDNYPNYELIRQLKQVPDIEQGTIIQYSNFERHALKTIRKELKTETETIFDVSELISWLDEMMLRKDSNHKRGPYFADLSRLVKNYYYNFCMADSLSIKDVVTSVLTVSEVLKKQYQLPYKSSNFDDMVWWQWNEKKGRACNPYSLLKAMQKGATIGRGTEAMVVYAKILSESLRASSGPELFKALLQYCELDTLAMVMIYQHWQRLAQNN